MSQEAKKPEGPQVITGSLHRVQRGKEKAVAEAPPAPPGPREPVRRPARVAIALAPVHKSEEAIERGAVADRANVARRLGLTRAGIMLSLDLTLLEPDLQARVLGLESVDGEGPLSERRLHAIASRRGWLTQRAKLAASEFAS